MDESSSHEDANKGGAAEAGVVRGASRTIGQYIRAVSQSAARLPSVGRLPGKIPRRISMPRKLPVKQVARISDRISQGYDVWDTAKESRLKLKLSRLKKFVVSE